MTVAQIFTHCAFCSGFVAMKNVLFKYFINFWFHILSVTDQRDDTSRLKQVLSQESVPVTLVLYQTYTD